MTTKLEKLREFWIKQSIFDSKLEAYDERPAMLDQVKFGLTGQDPAPASIYYHVIEKSYYDELLAKYNFMVSSAQHRAAALEEGFDACAKILMPIVMQLIETSEHLLNNLVSQRDIATANNLRSVHLEYDRFIKLAEAIAQAKEQLGLNGREG